MKTYQDFQKEVEKGRTIDFIQSAISEYMSSDEYKVALDADEYNAERNVTIMRWVKKLYTMDGREVPDFTSANHKIVNNFFHRLNNERCSYSLGNGISFAGENGQTTKEKLGMDFDTTLFDAAYYALIHRCSYLFWNYDHVNLFKLPEFLPLMDEYDGTVKAGIRFWSLDWNKRPVTVVLYEEDGYTKYQTKTGSKGLDLTEIEPKRGYIQHISYTEADGYEIIGESSYSALPIVPLWGNKIHQSTLIGMRGKLDAYDLISSGFANDLQECAEIYWLIGNAMGETDENLARFRDRLKLNHIAVADLMNSTVTPYTQDIPTEAKTTFLKMIRDQLYEDFGALDVHTVAAGATNDHIDAAYQSMDEEADEFEYEIIKCVRQILKLMGVDDIPIFKRNKISNQKDQTDMVLSASAVLDDRTILSKLPWITVDEIEEIMARKDEESAGRFTLEDQTGMTAQGGAGAE